MTFLENLRNYIYSLINEEENYYDRCLNGFATNYEDLKECRARIKYLNDLVDVIDKEETKNELCDRYLYLTVELRAYGTKAKRIHNSLSIVMSKLSRIKVAQSINKRRGKRIMNNIEAINTRILQKLFPRQETEALKIFAPEK